MRGVVLGEKEKSQRAALIAQVKEKGLEEVIEEVAYTWFNRFSALRYMEVNNYLPTHIRVFTDAEGNFKPEILTEVIHLEMDGLDKEKVYALKEDNDNKALFKYLLITQCNALADVLPGMFQAIADYTELLFPDNLLRTGSVLEQMVSLIPETDWQDQVQIIGWLYQYYNSEPKDRVFAELKKNKKITREKIPAATQLFTPDWIVRYMVENSLGRLWLLGHPDHKAEFLPDGEEKKLFTENHQDTGKWQYYVEEAAQETETQLAEIRKQYAALQPEDLTCLDPCMGSGHILCYLFDTLVKIYESYGYSARDAASLIVDKNLYGLDIDERAAQLAYFAVMMKGRQYDRRFFSRHLQLHVYAIEESLGMEKWSAHIKSAPMGAGDRVSGGGGMSNLLVLSESALQTADYLIDVFQDAKEYGSLLQVEARDYDGLIAEIKRLQQEGTEDLLLSGWLRTDGSKMIRLAQQAKAMSQPYWCVVTNPPYMSASNMNPKLNQFVKDNFADYKSDMFSASMVQCARMTKEKGFLGFLSPYVWMFISSYEKLRHLFIHEKTIETLIQFEYSAFEEATVPICTFVLCNTHIAKKGVYLRLTDYRGGMEVQREKALEALQTHDKKMYFEANAENFAKIPGEPVAYWVSESLLNVIGSSKTLGDIGHLGKGLDTGDNELFLRFWFEVSNFNKWKLCMKGGQFRKWFGNQDYVIDWENNGKKIKEYPKSNLRNSKYYFHEGLTWTRVSSANASFRYFQRGCIFESTGPCGFFQENLKYVLGLLNTKLVQNILTIIAPTLDFQSGHISKIPFIYDKQQADNIENIVNNNISLSKSDWDSFETSWDFAGHPLVWDAESGTTQDTECCCLTPAGDPHHRCFATVPSYGISDELFAKANAPCLRPRGGGCKISDAYEAYKEMVNGRFAQLQKNETELNKIFIDLYGLEDELTPEVADKDVTVHRLYDNKSDVPESMAGSSYILTKMDVAKSLLSYAVGCIFGWYSLDVPGLAYAGGEWDEGKYKTFIPDADAIIPITDDEYFPDDIVGRFVEFVKTVYGEDTLEENLQFIADALEVRGATSREVIRKYFLKDFYKDHCKTYQKRPIYWLFDSGKKNGFKCLVYMHRYQPDMLARIRTDYVHEQQARYRTVIEGLERESKEVTKNTERVRLNKKLEKLQKQAEETRLYEEKIHHLADQMMAIDLDDGVKHNYALFQDVLAKIK